jgi:hypothetical protein
MIRGLTLSGRRQAAPRFTSIGAHPSDHFLADVSGGKQIGAVIRVTALRRFSV